MSNGSFTNNVDLNETPRYAEMFVTNFGVIVNDKKMDRKKSIFRTQDNLYCVNV